MGSPRSDAQQRNAEELRQVRSVLRGRPQAFGAVRIYSVKHGVPESVAHMMLVEFAVQHGALG